MRRLAPETLLRSLHLLANLFWIGSLVAVGSILAARAPAARERGQLARLVYRQIATPAFGISFLAGLARLGLSPHYYFSDTHFMHAKLPLALAAIGVHHVLGARARRAEGGDAEAGRGAGWLTLSFVVLSAGAAWLVMTRPF